MTDLTFYLLFFTFHLLGKLFFEHHFLSITKFFIKESPRRLFMFLNKFATIVS